MKKRVDKKTLTKQSKIKGMICCSTDSCGGGLYFFGFIGAAIYYIQGATSFWMGVLGVLKAFVWPAFLIYKLLGM